MQTNLRKLTVGIVLAVSFSPIEYVTVSIVLASECDSVLAKRNIEWVVKRDVGARRAYNQARKEGLSSLDSVLQSQTHNKMARTSIETCGLTSHLILKNLLCEEAPINVNWVLMHDRRARSVFDNARQSGVDNFHALLEAQSHNPMASDSIRACGGLWARNYIRNRRSSKPTSSNQLKTEDDCGLAEQLVERCIEEGLNSFSSNYSSTQDFSFITECRKKYESENTECR